MAETSGFWNFNQGNNLGHSRQNVNHPGGRKYQAFPEKRFIRESDSLDVIVAGLYKSNPGEAISKLTSFSVKTGDQLVADWKKFYQFLFMKFKDGNIMPSEGSRLLDNGNGKGIPKKPAQPGYGKDWERKMIEGTGDRYKVVH
ncbi:MAG: hypothetical protein WCO93_03685 [bacterium]